MLIKQYTDCILFYGLKYLKMKNILYILLGVLGLTSACNKNDPLTTGVPDTPYYTGKFNTSYVENWDDWRFTLGDTTGFMRTGYANDWDNWDFSIEDLTYNGGRIDIYTNFNNDFDHWRIYDSGTGQTFRMRTDFNDDYDNWSLTLDGDLLLDIRTNLIEDWDNWRIYGDVTVLTNTQQVAVMFVALFAGGLYTQNFHQ